MKALLDCPTLGTSFTMRDSNNITWLFPDSLRFLLRHADSDLAALLADSVPPVDIHRIGIFRGACAKYDKQARHV